MLLLSLPCLADGPAEDQVKLRKIVIGFMQGTSSLDDIRTSGKSGIIAIENFFSEQASMDVKQLNGLVADLGSPNFTKRQDATGKLSVFPISAVPELEKHLKATKDPEVKERLRTVIASIRFSDKRLAELLTVLNSLYEDNAEDIFKEKLPLLMKDPKDIRAAYQLDNISFDRAWKILEGMPREDRLLWLLLKIARGDKAEEIFEKLKSFKADDVLKRAASTWWPIEIEPLQKDGTYGWTTRAQSIEGNAANNVIRISVKMPDYGNKDEIGEWEHFNHWGRLTYIFRFPPYFNKDTVAFIDPFEKCFSFTDWDIIEKREDGVRPGITGTFRGVPNGARLPFARISEKEALDWSNHNTYIWARPYFPPDLSAIGFAENKYESPVIEMPEKK